MQHHVFLSYSHKDAETMRQVRDDLRATGLTVWTDEGIEPGTTLWKDAVEKAIENAKCVVVILSPNSKQSIWVKKELEYADAQQIKTFSLLWEGDESNAIPFGLIGSQYIDIRKDYKEAIMKLVRGIEDQRIQQTLGKELSQSVIAKESEPGTTLQSPIWRRLRFALLFVVFIALLWPWWNRLWAPNSVFPQFGIGYFRVNAANYSNVSDPKLMACTGICLNGVQNILDFEATIASNGYAVVHFVKLPLTTADLGSQLLLRASLKTFDPDFEVGMWDANGYVFFTCHAPVIGQTSDYLINLDEAELTAKGIAFRPQEVIGLSIGFAQGAGSGAGRHHMEVHGIISIGNFAVLPEVSECQMRD